MGDPLYQAYHDSEWGRPVHDDRRLFEFLILEGAQAGLSWITVLRKRENYRSAFAGFVPSSVARFGETKVHALLANSRIIRNRAKIRSAINNARAFLEVVDEFKTFDSYVWRFVDHRPKVNRRKSVFEIPSFTVVSQAMSKDLKRRGFSFVGPGICYSFMQACGLVNDHITACYLSGRVLRSPR